jgi:RND family efflux transporter MFP subunit
MAEPPHTPITRRAPRGPRRARVRWLAGALAWGLVLATALPGWTAEGPPGPRDGGPDEGPDVGPMTAQPAYRTLIQSGFTRPRAEVTLVAETPGRVTEVFLDLGDAVPAQGAFARIDDTFIRLDREEVGVQQTRLRAQIDYDRREVARYQELARQSNASASQLDALQQALRDNGHELEALRVRARVLEERLARTTVRAPAGWRITARAVEPGQWVREGETLGRAADFSTLLVPFALTPQQFAALELAADQVRLTLPDRALEVRARIHRANPDFDPETRKIAVELALDGPLEHPRGGLRAELPLRIPERSGAVSVPRAAVGGSYEEHWVIRGDGTRLPVLLLGGDDDAADRVRVSAPGLAPGDRLRPARDS